MWSNFQTGLSNSKKKKQNKKNSFLKGTKQEILILQRTTKKNVPMNMHSILVSLKSTK